MEENNLYSIDHLVEFGLSLAVATQMANSMNAALGQMQTPGVDGPMYPAAMLPQPAPSIYYVALDGESLGPLGLVDLARFASEGRVCRESYVWRPGLASWQLAETLPEVLQVVAIVPPPLPDGLA